MGIKNQLDLSNWKLHKKNDSYNDTIHIANEVPGLSRNILFPRSSTHPTLPNIDLSSKLKLTPEAVKADYILVPHDWRDIKDNHEYMYYLRNLSRDTPLLIVNFGDIAPKCTLKNTIELRVFLHPWEKIDHKIVLPYPAKEKDFTIRSWKAKPRISFMGYVPKLSPGSLFGNNFQGLTKPIKSSVYINRKVSITKLRKLSANFNVHLQKRSTYTAYSSNPNLDLHMSEFEAELTKSDYVLCPRGFGNSSIRFFETLSSGATPILIDSGGVNPVIHNNDFWSQNVVNIKLFEKWQSHILNDWAFLGKGKNYEDRQAQNNKTFTTELKFEVYLEALFIRYLK